MNLSLTSTRMFQSKNLIKSTKNIKIEIKNIRKCYYSQNQMLIKTILE